MTDGKKPERESFKLLSTGSSNLNDHYYSRKKPGRHGVLVDFKLSRR
jgi:hypothetical protein